MIGSAIRQLATGWNSTQVCVALVESTIQVWDTTTRQQLGQFEGRYKMGAKTLALHPDGTQIVTGISEGRGIVSAYQAPEGILLWESRQLSYPARLRYSPSGHYVYCTIEDRNVEKIDVKTGHTVHVFQGACHIFEGSYGSTLKVPKSGPAYRISDERGLLQREIPIEKLTFALLDAAFSPDAIFLTESGGPVRCVDPRTGHEQWRFDPPAGSHVVSLHWSAEDDSVYGVLWHYEKGLFRSLMRFGSKDGRSQSVCDLRSWDEAFVTASNELVTSSGDMIDLSSGRVIGKLLFPQKQYPDRVGVVD